VLQSVDVPARFVHVSDPAMFVEPLVTRKRKSLVVTPCTGWLNVAITAPVNVVGGVNVTDVGPVTVKHAVHVVVESSVGFVNVTSRAPVAAPGSIVMFTVRLVALVRVVVLTVMPAPEKSTVVPFEPVVKPVPVITMSCAGAPFPH
jgi:hypothetical protein